MIREREMNRLKQEIRAFERTVKLLQKDLIMAYELAKPSISDSELEVLEKKEKRFRSMKRKLAEMENTLKNIQDGAEPVKEKAWKVRRPANEARLIMFCEA